MAKANQNRKKWIWLVFLCIFSLSLILGMVVVLVKPAIASPRPVPPAQEETYAGSQACVNCHQDIHTDWMTTRHAQAFSSPIFQKDWSLEGSKTSCLQCHTTGFNLESGSYTEEGVACEACHGPFQPTHPQEPMPIEPKAELCSTCHKNTTDEWRVSPHSQAGLQCQACHNPHSQTPMADSVTELCSNCHKERGTSFTHSTHANSGLECSNCHMYTSPRTEDPIGGLVATGHVFTVGSEACIGCHQDTVHTRDKLLKLSSEDSVENEPDVKELQQTILEQEEALNDINTISQARLYTGLVQGAIIGLVTGSASAWIVSKRIRIIEVEDDEEDDEEED